MNVPFRIRQVYFDNIVSGEKDNEIRRASEYWLKTKEDVIKAMQRHEEVIAVFERGGTGEIHRREILTIENYDNAFQALGRQPSEQGKKDLGDGPVLKFILGEAYPTSSNSSSNSSHGRPVSTSHQNWRKPIEATASFSS